MKPVPARCVRVGSISAIPKLLELFGLEPRATLALAGVDVHLFVDPENFMSFQDLGAVLEYCAAVTQCPYFGLLVGQRCELASLGLVGLMAREAPNLDTALRDFVSYLHLFDRATTVSISVEDDIATLAYAVVEPNIPATDQICDVAVAIMYNGVSELCGSSWAPISVLLPHAAPPDATPYRRFFQVPIKFDADKAALVFAAKWLDYSRSGSDSLQRQRLRRRVLAAYDIDDRSLAEQVRCRLSADSKKGWDETQMAQQFRIDRSTLRRKLAKDGTTFRHLSEEVRFQMAKQLLRYSKLGVGEIAAALGYSELSAFTRAFSKWSGVPPSGWRKQNAHEPAFASISSPDSTPPSGTR